MTEPRGADAPSGRIERLEEVLAYREDDNPWVRLYFDRVRFPDGREGHYNRIVEGTAQAGVVVLPTDGQMIGLVRIFRYPIGTFVTELPRGFGDSDDPLQDAARELMEETGWLAESYRSLGVIHPDSGLIDGSVELFLAQIGSWQPRTATDAEVASHHVQPVSDVYRDAANGAITDAYTLACLLRAHLRGVFD